MKNFLVILFLAIFLLSLFNDLLFSSYHNENIDELSKEILKIESELNQIQEKLKLTKENLFNIKKLIALALIKEKILKNNLVFFNNDKEWFELRKKISLYSHLYLSLYNELLKKEKIYQNLTLLYQKKIEVNKKLKEKYYTKLVEKGNFTIFKNKISSSIFYDPLTGEIIKEGKYKKKVQIGTPVLSPIDGIAKKIGVFDGILSITIENDKCFAFLSGFSIVNISLGERIKAKEKIGEVGFSEDNYNFYYEIYCSK